MYLNLILRIAAFLKLQKIVSYEVQSIKQITLKGNMPHLFNKDWQKLSALNIYAFKWISKNQK